MLHPQILARITSRFAPLPPNGFTLPEDRNTIQLRIGTLGAETTWAEISELTGLSDPQGSPETLTTVFPAIESSIQQQYDLTKRLMVRIYEEPGFGDRLVERLRPGSLRNSQSEWLVWGERAERWREEP